MSIEVYKPNEVIPYTVEQVSTLCKPEAITPETFLNEDWLEFRYGIFYIKDGVPIGVAFCSVYESDEETEKHMHLHILCVSQTERKGGYGSKLLKQVETLAISLGLTTIRLSAISNQLTFYKRNGYVSTGSEDEDYIGMMKRLSGGSRKRKTRRVQRIR
jgi:GNAT superfamily N-acetyltransferase